MSYEQFLKQLRRIGRQLMFGSILAATISVTYDFFANTPITTESVWIYKVLTIMFIVGLTIYPVKSEE